MTARKGLNVIQDGGAWRARGQPDEAAPERAGPPHRACDADSKLGGASPARGVSPSSRMRRLFAGVPTKMR